jgi:AcrR family transcriptional regulator
MTAEGRRAVIEEAATAVFAAQGYQRASVEEIARRARVTVPVVYDHFESKLDLYHHLLDLHFAGMRGSWGSEIVSDAPAERRIARGIDAWFTYVRTHPFAWRMLFRDTTGDSKVEAIRRKVAARSWAEVLRVLPREVGAEKIFGSNAEALEMAVEVFRTGLQGLALWWHEHPRVPQELVVTAAMNALWIGIERVRRGDVWRQANQLASADGR